MEPLKTLPKWFTSPPLLAGLFLFIYLYPCFLSIGAFPMSDITYSIQTQYIPYLGLSLFSSMASAAEPEAGCLREAGEGMGNVWRLSEWGWCGQLGRCSLRICGMVSEALHGVYVLEQVYECLGVCQECADRPCCSSQCTFQLSPLGSVCRAEQGVVDD